MATNQLSRNAQGIVNKAAGGGDEQEERRRRREAEEALMGGTSASRKDKGSSSSSDIKERNLSQMVAVLHSRIGSLEKMSKVRMELAAHDLNPNSTQTSRNAPRLGDDLDFLTGGGGDAGNSSSGQAARATRSHNKDSLVSAEGVYLDPQTLVFRTKPQSEAAKKLEASLEDIFGSSSATRFKGKKNTKAGGGAKRSSQQKYEAKKGMRQRLEKQLVTNMESFVTRSVLEPEVVFVAPLSLDEAADWPIPVKYSAADPLAQRAENADGELDPELILRYALQKISLPSGEKLFGWLARQPALQHYYLYLFWLLKTKFFQQESDLHNETYLLHHASRTYAGVLELLQGRTHVEHEKDFVYRFLPYILCNAVYFGFMYLCPGSRHLYTKGFRKTLLMQIVLMMHGVQMCPVSVKVSWAKLFPDDAHEDEDGGEGGDSGAAESFPVPAALAASRQLEQAKTRAAMPALGLLDSASLSASSVPTGPGAASRGGVLADSDALAGEAGAEAGAGGRARARTSSAAAGATAGAGPEHGLLPSLVQGGSAPHPSSSSSVPDGGRGMGEEESGVDPLERTFLTAPLRRPDKRFVSIRQNVETLDAKNVSPFMQKFLGAKHSSSGHRQVLARTVPVSWCPAGGVDTYHKQQVSKELLDAISAQLSKSKHDFQRMGVMGHRRKLAAAKLVERTCNSILSGGQARVSQTALDLIKRQRAGKEKQKETVTVGDLEEEVPPGLDLYADFDLDVFLAELDA